jgi:hypothetical protein
MLTYDYDLHTVLVLVQELVPGPFIAGTVLVRVRDQHTRTVTVRISTLPATDRTSTENPELEYVRTVYIHPLFLRTGTSVVLSYM